MSDSVPSSPLPSGVETTETTRLLNTNSSSYNTRGGITAKVETVVNMYSSSKVNISKLSFDKLSDGGLSGFRQKIQKAISEGIPSLNIPLTDAVESIIDEEIERNKQERALMKERERSQQGQGNGHGQEQEHDQKQKYKQDQKVPSDDTSSSSSSDSDEEGFRHSLHRKLSALDWSHDHKKEKKSKRHMVGDTIKYAADKWKEQHGYSTGSNHGSSASLVSSLSNVNTAATTTTAILNSVGNAVSSTATTAIGNSFGNAINTTVAFTQKFKPKLTAEKIFSITKNASVCGLLALLHKKRQSSGFSVEKDISLQNMALITLNLGLRAYDTSLSQVVLYEMLTNKWETGKSALEWAVETDCQLILNDKRVQQVIEELWKSGPNWRQDKDHPSHIWLNQAGGNKQEEEPKNFALYASRYYFIEFLARWPSARYQALTGLFSILIYVAFHLGTVTNVEYTSDTPFFFEYIYYVLVVSDFCFEYFKLFTQPCTYLKKASSYVSLLTSSLLFAALVLRFFALVAAEGVSGEVYFLELSFNLLIIATPLMFFRIFAATTSLLWSSAKVDYILHNCIANSIWVFTLGLFVILGFWLALAALQYNDINPFAMLRYMILGALHSPVIGKTVLFQPVVAGLLLVVYLFFTVVILGSLLTASFLATILEIYGRIDVIKREWVINRCLKPKPTLGYFFPSFIIDSVFGIIAWVARVVFKHENEIVLLEKARQVFWYLIYSPVILLVGIIELVLTIILRWNLVQNAFKRIPFTAASYK